MTKKERNLSIISIISFVILLLMINHFVTVVRRDSGSGFEEGMHFYELALSLILIGLCITVIVMCYLLEFKPKKTELTPEQLKKASLLNCIGDAIYLLLPIIYALIYSLKYIDYKRRGIDVDLVYLIFSYLIMVCANKVLVFEKLNNITITNEVKNVDCESESKNVKKKENKSIVNNVDEKFQSIELLKKYKELLDSGVITEEEFNEKKKELI